MGLTADHKFSIVAISNVEFRYVAAVDARFRATLSR